MAVSPEDLREAAGEVAGSWWLFLVAGIAWLIFAFVVLSFDFTTVWAVAVFAGFMFLFFGVNEFFAAAYVDDWKWLHVLLGVIAVAAGIIAFVWPGQTFLTLAAIIAWLLLFMGTFNIVTALLTKDENDLWWLTLLIGIAEVLIAFWAIGYEGRSIALLVIWVGAAALARGIMNIVLAFTLRSAEKNLTSAAT
jgi:uncharacterized membrane protein HdeD (DUF308 family)